MRAHIVVAFAVVAFAAAVSAQGAPVAPPAPSVGVCAALNQSINANLKQLALSSVRVYGSGAAAGYGGAEQTNVVRIIGFNVSLLASYKCPARLLSVDPSIYVDAAKRCVKARSLPDHHDKACDLSTWRPSAPPAD